MIKKVFLWVKTTEVWINLAQIYTVFLCLFMIKYHILGGAQSDKLIGLLAFVLLVVLLYRYELYKKLQFWLLTIFFIMTYIAGLEAHYSILKSIGSPVHRNWYIYLLALTVGYVLDSKKRYKWINVLFIVQATILTIVFVISIIGATEKLFNPDYEVYKLFGTIVSGRLGTFGSPNTAGPAAVVLILLTVILIYRTRSFKYRKFTNIVFAIYLLIGWIELGLSRSRGAIIAAAVGIGAFFFILIYDKYKEGRAKGFLLGFVVFTAITVASASLFLIPKPLYDKAAIDYVEKHNPSDAERVRDKLDCYGITYALDNLTDRTSIWGSTVNMLNEKPIRWVTGALCQRIGEAKIFDVYEGRPEIPVNTVHNGYLQQLFMYGIPGATLLAIMLIIWIAYAFKAVFSREIVTGDKILSILMAAAVINAMVEAFLFPFHIIYPISFFFFMSEGCLEGIMDKKEKSVKKRILIIVVILATLTIAGILTYHMYTKKKAEYHKVTPVEVKEQNPNDYVRLTNGISQEMMTALYWISLRENRGIDVQKERLSLAEIYRFNHLNRRMLTTANTAFSLYEIGDEFYYKVAKNFVTDIMIKVEDPSKYLVDGKPTDEAYWENLKDNANLEALNSRISVKFGVSVDNTILKRYPVDDDIFMSDSSMYYDELARSDLLPFMPVAILHESADGEWYYVITYGYGGWIRKESVALYDTKEEWLSKSEPEDFLIVTGKELRLSTDPYNKELSGLLLPMGTKLPIVPIGETPEDIHGRVGYGNYVAKLPTRNAEGGVEEIYVLIPSTEDVSLGYLPYTEENVSRLAFKHLGAVYGWAGDNNGQDCSGFVREIYACFGYVMPRATKPQSGIECTESYRVEGWSREKIMEVLTDAPIGTLMYFPGHIMVYLGTENGVPYCISSVGNFANNDGGNTNLVEVNTVIVTDMIDTVRADGKPWIDSIVQIVIP